VRQDGIRWTGCRPSCRLPISIGRVLPNLGARCSEGSDLVIVHADRLVEAGQLKRPETDLRSILTVGSVEGEQFSAEVLARAEACAEREVVRQLSREPLRLHRLVSEQGWLPYHFEQSDVPDRMACYRLQAGDRALCISVHREAGDHFRHWCLPTPRARVHGREAGRHRGCRDGDRRFPACYALPVCSCEAAYCAATTC